MDVKDKEVLIQFHDTSLKRYKTTEELTQAFQSVVKIIDTFLTENPELKSVPGWLTPDSFYNVLSKDKTLTELFISIGYHMQLCGFSMPALLNSTVIFHDPRSQSVIKTQAVGKLVTVH